MFSSNIHDVYNKNKISIYPENYNDPRPKSLHCVKNIVSCYRDYFPTQVDNIMKTKVS